MKRLHLLSAFIFALTAAAPSAFAASGGMPGMEMPSAQEKSPASPAVHGYMAHGVVNSVNLAAGTVNITHQPIKALGWPGMTMDFSLQDRGLLKQIKRGETVDFDLAKGPTGQYVVTKMVVVH